MSIFSRIYNYVTNTGVDVFAFDVDVFAFDIMHYSSMTDYIHGDGIPSFNLYTHYYGDAKKFVVYESDETFNESDPKYTNVRKIKVSDRFCFELEQQYT